MVEPMDSTGCTRTDYTAEEIAQFDESKADRLAHLLEAEKELNAATDAAHSIELVKSDHIETLAKFKREGEKQFPPITQHLAYMAVLRATSPSHQPKSSEGNDPQS